MRKKRNAFSSKPKAEEKASRLEQLVNEVMIQKKLNSEKRFSTISEHRYSGSLQETIVGFPHDNIYNHSYQEALNRYHIQYCVIVQIFSLKSKYMSFLKICIGTYINKH